MKKEKITPFLDLVTRITTVPALEDDAVVYIPRMMSQVGFPSRNLHRNEFTRINGRFKLSMLSPSHIGLPYGMGARDLVCFITTYSKLNKTREISIGQSISALAKRMGKHRSGGKNGSITTLREHCKRLMSTSISWIEDTDGCWNIESLRIAQEASILWDPNQNEKWEAFLYLEEAFFNDIQSYAIPIDRRVKSFFCHYPLAFDSYCWLTARNFRLHKPTQITWAQLEGQFGNVYARRSNFKAKFSEALNRVNLIYPQARFDTRPTGVLLFPSPPHVPPSTNTSYNDTG